MTTKDLLEGAMGTHISTHCSQQMTADNLNHCAHFVSHIMGYQFGYQCGNQTQLPGEGANIRVQEIFARCPIVGVWSDKPKSLKTCLAFITKEGNVNLARKVMSNVPRKHIGVFADGFIYHYSNSQDQVVRQTPAQFSRHYMGAGYAVFYGTLIS
ncbi:hypothetical protein [Neptunomonas sp.]|uniref:hypothetical protein n=1 Tax=Neptunomonas sp. TaxID=1971898 RepID=UPI0025E36F7E|nr:hypothetical protein [Neptunomonas sp.]